MEPRKFEISVSTALEEAHFECIFEIRDFVKTYNLLNYLDDVKSETHLIEPYNIRLAVIFSKDYIKAQFIGEEKLDFVIMNYEISHKKADTVISVCKCATPIAANAISGYTSEPHTINYGVILSNPNEALENGSNLFVSFETTLIFPNYNKSCGAVQKNRELDVSSNVSKEFEKLFENPKFSDVELSCGGKNFSAHKNILWSRSTTFAKIFDQQNETTKTDVIWVEEISPEVFTEGLYFIYTGKCRKMEEMASNLLIFAEKYGVEELKKICEQELIKIINITNICEYFVLADKYVATLLTLSCLAFLSNNREVIMDTTDWKLLSIEQPHLYTNVLKALDALTSKDSKR